MTIAFLLLAILQLQAQKEYNFAQRHADSLKVYNVYRGEIAFMQECSKYDRFDVWHERELYDDSATACARVRLTKYNGKEYKFNRRVEVNGFGEALMYPAPSKIMVAAEPKRFSLIDDQTRFITFDGKTKIPYVIRNWFDDKSHLLQSDTIDPKTLKHLVLPNTVPTKQPVGMADAPVETPHQ